MNKWQTQYIFISKGIFGKISIVLCFIILELEFNWAFGKANCRVLVYVVLHGWTSV